MSKLIDLTGIKVGRLTVLCREGTYQRPSGNKEPTWRCRCECGNEVVVLSSNLKKKNTLSCGCLQTENRFGPKRETRYEIRGDLVYIKTFESKDFVISLCDLDMVIAHRWRINASGYVADENGNTIHRVLMNPPSVMDVHHINGDKLDNRRSNLLMLTRSEHTSLHHEKNIANGVTVQRWIPVSEPPEPFETVFIYDATRHEVAEGYMTRHKEWVGVPMSSKVTHWMQLPLPEPPKEVEDNA